MLAEVIDIDPEGKAVLLENERLPYDTLKADFRHINPGSARVVLVERVPCVLAACPESLSAKAKRALERLGMEVVTDTVLTHIDGMHVRLKTGDRGPRS